MTPRTAGPEVHRIKKEEDGVHRSVRAMSADAQDAGMSSTKTFVTSVRLDKKASLSHHKRLPGKISRRAVSAAPALASKRHDRTASLRHLASASRTVPGTTHRAASSRPAIPLRARSITPAAGAILGTSRARSKTPALPTQSSASVSSTVRSATPARVNRGTSVMTRASPAHSIASVASFTGSASAYSTSGLFLNGPAPRRSASVTSNVTDLNIITVLDDEDSDVDMDELIDDDDVVPVPQQTMPMGPPALPPPRVDSYIQNYVRLEWGTGMSRKFPLPPPSGDAMKDRVIAHALAHKFEHHCRKLHDLVVAQMRQ